jgi:hypothetical protein
MCNTSCDVGQLFVYWYIHMMYYFVPEVETKHSAAGFWDKRHYVCKWKHTMKNERYHTAGAALKLDRKIVETEVKSTSLTHIYMAASCPVLVLSCMLLVCGRHLHDHILSFRGQVWLTPSLFIEVPAQGQDRKRPCICASGMSILPLFLHMLNTRSP